MIRQLFRAVWEAVGGIKRNLLVSFVCASTVALSLLLVGLFALLAMNIELITREIESQVEIKVYLEDDLYSDYIEDLRLTVLSMPGVWQVTYISREQALEDLKEEFGSEAGILEAVTEMNPLPDTFDVRVDPDTMALAVSRIEGLPGVESVRDRRELVDRLLSITTGIRTAGVFLAGLMMVAALVIIANTIRIAVYTRRTEISIMKLVGATDGFIRMPFMIEGMLLGLIGGGAAGAGLWYGYEWVYVNVMQALPFLPLVPREPDVYEVVRALIVAGLVLGMTGSTISIRRYLRA